MSEVFVSVSLSTSELVEEDPLEDEEFWCFLLRKCCALLAFVNFPPQTSHVHFVFDHILLDSRLASPY